LVPDHDPHHNQRQGAAQADGAQDTPGAQSGRPTQRPSSLWDTCERVRTVVHRFPGVERVYLVGPASGLSATSSASEVDIAIEGKLDTEDYVILVRALEEVVASWQIDLVELGRDLHVAARVRERGMMIYERANADP
jgi:hypothetical protein